MAVIVSRGGRDARRIERSSIEQEDYLQRYVYNNPEVLPLHELKEEIRLLILGREFPTGSGPIDALGIDGDGDLYIIETKLFKNGDKRRVVAQMLDYGASLWASYSDAGEFIARVEELVVRSHGVGLSQKLCEFFGTTAAELPDFIEAIKENLGSGQFRFVVLMDRMDDRLKDLIAFINSNSSFDILGVELDLYQHEEFEIIIPNMHGAIRKKAVTVSQGGSSRRKHDEESFFSHASELLGKQDSAAVRRLFEWSNTHADSVQWGTGSMPTFNAKFARVHPTKSVFSVNAGGLLHLNFGWLREPESAAQFAKVFRDEIRVRGLLPLEENVLDKYPQFKPEAWTGSLDALLQALESTLPR